MGYAPWDEWKNRTGWQDRDRIVAGIEARIRDLDEQRDELWREAGEEAAKPNHDESREIELLCEAENISADIALAEYDLKRWGYEWSWNRMRALPVESEDF